MTDAKTEAHADVVAVFRAENMEQVLQSFRPLDVDVQQGADVMEHPLETGAVIADHIVELPVSVELYGMILAEDVAAVTDECRELQNEGALLVVQTSSGTFDSMVLHGFPLKESPEALGAPSVLLRLKQAKFVEPEYGTMAPGTTQSPAQARTTARGQQPARPAAASSATNGTANTTNARNAQAERKGSTLYRMFNRGGGS